jgi:hypothetical protein
MSHMRAEQCVFISVSEYLPMNEFGDALPR